MLVSFVFAFLIGWESGSEQTLFKPVFSLADSCSKLFYNIAVFFTEVMAVCIVAIMTKWMITFRDIWDTGIYTPLILMLLCDFVIIVGIIYPLIIFSIISVLSIYSAGNLISNTSLVIKQFICC